MILAHCNLRLLDSSDYPAAVYTEARTSGVYYHASLIFVFLVVTGFCHVGQAGHELLASAYLPALATQSVGMTYVSHRTRLDSLSKMSSTH